MGKFNGLGLHLGNLSRLSDAQTRSISAENPTGEKGKGGMAHEGFGAKAATDLGQGWKVSPAVWIDPHSTFTIAEIDGPGAIQSIWLAGDPVRRECILRMYWDDQNHPSVECPISDFFAVPWEKFCQINSIPVSVNPNNGVNCYWEMPFRKSARITIENRTDEKVACYYQINYTLTDISEDVAYFHAQFRRSNPLSYKEVHTLIDGIVGKGHYVGTAIGWGVHNNGWWGEGEIKFFLDGDGKFATIVGTGTEDYFGGAYNWDVDGRYTPYSTPYLGMQQVSPGGEAYNAVQRFAMYRWHVMDPIRFDEDLRVTIQALGWRSRAKTRHGSTKTLQSIEERQNDRRYLPLQDDISSVAIWYQSLPTSRFPPLASRECLEIN
ncbi:MAG: hypothetical protein CMO31_06495 [Trueperaceae bacterium]|jgi:hypothetical protein|nr:hypothetical protein [Trueperaceae bacterium]|tara:strand:+ start:43741 stop:44877 length:1137 start_codon:yes stop_codon:yes gene_type:complete